MPLERPQLRFAVLGMAALTSAKENGVDRSVEPKYGVGSDRAGLAAIAGLTGGMWIGLLDVGHVGWVLSGWQPHDWNALTLGWIIALILLTLATASLTGALLALVGVAFAVAGRSVGRAVTAVAGRRASPGSATGHVGATTGTLLLGSPLLVGFVVYLGNRPLPQRALGSWRFAAMLLALVLLLALARVGLAAISWCCDGSPTRKPPLISWMAGLGLLGGSAALFVVDLTAYRGLYFFLHLLTALGALGCGILGWSLLSRPRRPLRQPWLWIPLLVVAHVLAAQLLLGRSWAVRSAAYDLTVYQQKAFVVLFAPLRWARSWHTAPAPPSPATAPRAGHAGERLQRLRDTIPLGSATTAPNIVLISFDSLRAQHVTQLAERLRSFDLLRPRAVEFTAAYAPGANTTLTLATWAAARELSSADQLQTATLHEALREAGYQQLCAVPLRIAQPAHRRALRACDLFVAGRWTTVQVDRAVARFVQTRDPGRPVFVHLHIMETHREWRGGKDEGGFFKALARNDRAVARWLRLFETTGLTQHAVVVLTSDHGEAFGERGVFGHESQLYNEQLQVPLLIWSSGRKAPMRYARPVSTGWLGQTLLALSGVAGAEQLPGPVISARQPVFATQGSYRAVIDGTLKLIFHTGKSTLELYDLEADPDERVNLADRFVPQRQRLGRLLAGRFDLQLLDSP